MKKLLLVALFLLVMGAGVFFIGGMGDEPLRVDIATTKKVSDGSMDIYFTISNRTARHCYFFAYPQILSNGRWLLDDGAGKPIGTTQQLSARASRNLFVRASEEAGMRRLQIKYQLAKSPRREKIEKLLQKIHFGPLPYDSELREFTTPPFEPGPR
jgi:hypothetical protein